MPDPRGSKGATRKKHLRTAAILAVIAGAAALYWYQTPGPEAARPARAGSRPAVRVSIAVAARQDVPVYATGLGAVQASYTIGIHSQVEGIMQEVLFTEGQHVKKGDVLARIDPRLYQAALDQAKAKRVQDAALLISAEKDLARSKTLVVQNVATQQLVDQQQARVDQLKGSVAADEAAIETTQTQTRLHADQVAERRAHRGALGRSRKSRACLRRARDRHRRAHATFGRDVHAADAGA
jgi:membrane fusion protein, multidrug efflux system